jgi:hypothetical protein
MFGVFFVGKFGGLGNQLSQGQTITPIKIQDFAFFRYEFQAFKRFKCWLIKLNE